MLGTQGGGEGAPPPQQQQHLRCATQARTASGSTAAGQRPASQTVSAQPSRKAGKPRPALAAPTCWVIVRGAVAEVHAHTELVVLY